MRKREYTFYLDGGRSCALAEATMEAGPNANPGATSNLKYDAGYWRHEGTEAEWVAVLSAPGFTIKC